MNQSIHLPPLRGVPIMRVLPPSRSGGSPPRRPRLSRADWLRVERLLPDVLILPQDARGDYLRRQCGGNRALLDELESLLRADAGPGRLLDAPVRFRRGRRPG
jgi:hypothetical protein